MRRRTRRIMGQFVPHRIEMLESPAYRALSLSGHRVLARIEIEHGHHGGVENGKLPVTFDDFEAYGISPKSVAPALREVQALGFVRVTERGRPSKSDFGRHPNHFELTYIHGAAPRYDEETDEWKQHQTLEEALRVAKEARAKKDKQAVAKAKAKSKNRAPQKSEARGHKIPLTGSKNHPKWTGSLGVKNHPTVMGGKNDPTSYISGEGEASESPASSRQSILTGATDGRLKKGRAPRQRQAGRRQAPEYQGAESTAPHQALASPPPHPHRGLHALDRGGDERPYGLTKAPTPRRRGK
jgi:hypothetical protein